MKKLDIYYHCKPKGQENGFFSVEDVLSADDIKYPKFFIPVQIDVVKTETREGLDGEEITSTSTMKYTIGSLEQTAKVLTEIKEDEGRIVKTPYRTLSALKMAFIGDTIDYLGSNNKTETPAKTYTKNTKYKGHFDNNSNK